MKNYKLKQEFVKHTKETRLYKIDFPIIAITGSIACGKSAVMKRLDSAGFTALSADILIKDIYKSEIGKTFLKETFPNVEFNSLRKLFFLDQKIREKIEDFIYPHLEKKALEVSKTLGAPNFVFFEVPLLFEKQLQNKVDVSICVYCSKEQQLKRLISRENLDPEKDQDYIQALLSSQLDQDEKAKLSDFCISTENDIIIQDLLDHLLIKT